MAPKRTSVRIPINARLWASGLDRYGREALVAWAAALIEAHLEADDRTPLPPSTTVTEPAHDVTTRSPRTVAAPTTPSTPSSTPSPSSSTATG